MADIHRVSSGDGVRFSGAGAPSTDAEPSVPIPAESVDNPSAVPVVNDRGPELGYPDCANCHCPESAHYLQGLRSYDCGTEGCLCSDYVQKLTPRA